eukprot:s1037_g2.t2
MEEDEILALQRPPHLLDFGPLTPSELVNHLECMPRQFAEIVACRFRWMLRSLRIAWMWFCFEVFPLQLLQLYFDTLVHAIAEYPEPEDTRHYSLYLTRYAKMFRDYFAQHPDSLSDVWPQMPQNEEEGAEEAARQALFSWAVTALGQAEGVVDSKIELAEDSSNFAKFVAENRRRSTGKIDMLKHGQNGSDFSAWGSDPSGLQTNQLLALQQISYEGPLASPEEGDEDSSSSSSSGSGLSDSDRVRPDTTTEAYKAPALKSRISQLGARLLGLSSASSSARAVPIGSLDAMLVLCEDAIGPLEGMQTQLIASQAEAARFAAEVEQERVRCRHLEARLRSATEEIACLRKRVTSWLDQQEHCDTHAASTCEKDGRLQPASLEEALQDCAASVSRLEALPAPAKGEALATAGTCANEEAWEPNTRHCSLCCASLGKRFWRPRHHCRFCGRCVCGACSRSFIGTANQPWQRCCAKCALAVTQSPWLQQMALIQTWGASDPD